MMITINSAQRTVSEIEDINSLVQKEVKRKEELEEWNDKYQEEFGHIGENNVDIQDYNVITTPVDPAVQDDDQMTQKQVKRQIRDETYQ